MEDPEPYLFILYNLVIFQFSGFNLGIIASILVILVLFVISALVSGSEVAYFSLSPSELDKINHTDNRLNTQVNKHLKHPERLLATILITNNFVNVGIVVLSSFITSALFDFGDNKLLGLIIQVVVITFLILFFSEILPKIYANRFSLSFARFTAPGLQFFTKVFWPLSSILISSTAIVHRRLRKKKANISLDELSDALELTESNLVEEKSILKGIVKFGNIDVSEIMCPRVDVVGININTSFNELIKVINDSGFSRLPIYAETFDEIKGILYIKDLLQHLNKPSSFRWQSLIRPSYFVPESKKINDLLKEFQTNRIHMAIVVDEYGGTSGIITLEDILEEIVGEISDESDEEVLTYEQIDEDNFIFEGKTQLNDFYKVVGVEDDVFDEVKGEADTLAGLILELRGEIPKKSDKLSYKNFVFEVRAVDQRRIKEIHVNINRKGSDES